MKIPKNHLESYYTFKKEEYYEDGYDAPLVCEAFDYMGLEIDNKKLFTQPIVYTYYDKNKKAIYCGKSIYFKNRIDNHRRQNWFNEAYYIGIILCENADTMDIIEVLEIHRKQPKFNGECINTEFKNKYSILLCPTVDQLEIKCKYEEFVFDIGFLIHLCA